MRRVSEYLQEKLYRKEKHPYRIYEKIVERQVRKGIVLVDAGCGRDAPVLRKFTDLPESCVGLDMVSLEARGQRPPLHLVNCDLTSICLRDDSVDLVISRSVMEHLSDPGKTYRKVARILKPGGSFVFLTPNLLDYGSLIAKAIPNRFHGAIVRMTEGRAEEDTFAAYYRSNSSWRIGRLADECGLSVRELLYLGQYPSYLLFNAALFLLGALYDKVVSRFDSLGMFRSWILCVLDKKGSQPGGAGSY